MQVRNLNSPSRSEILINEFKAVCSKTASGTTTTVIRYNEEYTLFGNRGTYFDIKSVNTFNINEIVCDLSKAHSDTNVSTCTITKGNNISSGTFIHRDADDKIIANWYVE